MNQDGVTKVFKIVGVDEIDTAKGRISWQSPIGKNLIGKSQGEEIIIQVPAGETVYEIVSIIYESIE